MYDQKMLRGQQLSPMKRTFGGRQKTDIGKVMVWFGVISSFAGELTNFSIFIGWQKVVILVATRWRICTEEYSIKSR